VLTAKEKRMTMMEGGRGRRKREGAGREGRGEKEGNLGEEEGWRGTRMRGRGSKQDAGVWALSRQQTEEQGGRHQVGTGLEVFSQEVLVFEDWAAR
jgi:hypothetical protein